MAAKGGVIVVPKPFEDGVSEALLLIPIHRLDRPRTASWMA